MTNEQTTKQIAEKLIADRSNLHPADLTPKTPLEKYYKQVIDKMITEYAEPLQRLKNK